jgi:inorganic pyrophosphatase/exopolyphosphatase
VAERTTILVSGHAEAVAEAFDRPLIDGHAIELPGILSRKKNIVPMLSRIAAHIPG